MQHSSYKPDLAPIELFFFLKLNIFLVSKIFKSEEDIKRNKMA